MKKAGGLIIALTMVMPVLLSPEAAAAACANVSSFGAVQLNVPTLPDTKNKVLWARMQAAEPSAKILAEINNQHCLEIGGSLPANQWSWQSSPAGPVIFPSPDGNSVKLIGVSDGVKIDRILLTEPSCAPKDFGNNCQNAVELKHADGPPAVILPPPSGDAVGGKVILSSTPDKNRDQLEVVEYIVDAKVVQRISGPQPFDTTLLPNGKHSVQIHTKLKGGSVIRESTVVDVHNPETLFTPLMRWIRLNFQLAKIAGLTIGSAVVLAAALNIIRTWHLNRRHRRFHGF